MFNFNPLTTALDALDNLADLDLLDASDNELETAINELMSDADLESVDFL